MVSVQFILTAAAACDASFGITTNTPTPMSATRMVTVAPISMSGEKRRFRREDKEFPSIFAGSRGFVSIAFSKAPFNLCHIAL